MTASVSRPISLKFCQEEWRGDRGRSLSSVEWSAEGQRDRGIKSPEMSLLGCRLQALPLLCLSALLLANLVGEEWGMCWRWDSLGGVPLGFITCVGSHVRHTHGRIHTHAYTHTSTHRDRTQGLQMPGKHSTTGCFFYFVLWRLRLV